jgi:hypothetical protein
MDKFLGLPIRRKRLTDAEHVERIRKDVLRAKLLSKWLVLFAAILGICCLWLFIYFVQSFVQSVFANQPLIGFGLGLTVGLILGLLCVGLAIQVGHLLQQAIRVWKVDRTSELLVKYHDMLIELAQANVAKASDGAGQGGEEAAPVVPTPHYDELISKQETSVM